MFTLKFNLNTNFLASSLKQNRTKHIKKGRKVLFILVFSTLLTPSFSFSYQTSRYLNVEMKIETAHLSVAIENFCFSEIVPARLTKTISLTNVQHFGHFFLLQLDTKSTTHSPPTLTWTQFTATTTFLLKLCRGCISPQYSDVDINILSLVKFLSIQLNFHSRMPVAEWS